MKNHPLIIFEFVMLFANHSQSQNLIYNGDFELYDTCPIGISSPGNYQINYCLGWKTPTYATSDYYNGCNNTLSGVVGVPANTMGFQYAYSGNAYCGILNEVYKPGYGFWFEYIQSKLLSPLVAGNEYEFTCNLVLAENGAEFAYWKFGITFSVLPIVKSDGKPFIGITPQIMNQANNFIVDTTNWIEVNGKFIAQGGEEYITLGFYPDTLNPDTLRFTSFPVDTSNFISYYFIDACNLSEIPNTYPNIFSPNEDGINDVFSLKNLKEGDIVEIFDRWGIKLSELNKPKAGWDGYTSSGIKCNAGVYYYLIKKSDTEIIKGFFHLQY